MGQEVIEESEKIKVIIHCLDDYVPTYVSELWAISFICVQVTENFYH